MEAATPLRFPHAGIINGTLVVDGLTTSDRCTVELVQSRIERGEDAMRVIAEALEIGARVLDREQAGATVELFRADLEKSTAAAERVLTERTRDVADAFTRAVERHFSDDSSAAVQHRIKAVLDEVSRKSREDLVRQFSAGDASNPLADFKAGVVRVAQQQVTELVAMREQMTELRQEVARLHAEKDKAAGVAAEHERSTAKGRPYEEAVYEAIEAIAAARGDDAEAVGDVGGAGGRKGDVVVGVDGCAGPARARIVVEAKNSQVSRKSALEYLEDAMAVRDAAYGIWVVPSESALPARTTQLREVNGDKLFVVYDPDGGPLALEVAYGLARARVLMARAGSDGLDAAAVQAEVERALGALEDERRVKAQLTTAANSVGAAREIVEKMASNVREHLREIDALLDAAGDDDP